MMKRVFIVLAITLIGCNKPNVTNQKSNVSDNKSDSLKLTHNDSLYIKANLSILSEANYNSYEIFDSMSIKSKQNYIHNHKNQIGKLILDNYDHYSRIKNIDTIFDVLCASRIDSIKNIELLPFYVYILNEINDNKHTDGFIGEFIADMYCNFLLKYPGYYYQYMGYKLSRNRKSYVDILHSTSYGISEDKQYTEQLLNEFKNRLKTKSNDIDSINSFILTH